MLVAMDLLGAASGLLAAAAAMIWSDASIGGAITIYSLTGTLVAMALAVGVALCGVAREPRPLDQRRRQLGSRGRQVAAAKAPADPAPGAGARGGRFADHAGTDP